MIRNRAILTLSAFGAMFFLGVGTAIIGAASRNIGLTPSQIGLMVSIQNVGFVISVVTVGSLADSVQKTRLLAGASLILAVSFALFYYQDPFILNLIIMLAIGLGIGGYEGAADPLLLEIYKRRQSLVISVNHFFVTFGELLIALYLIFLQMDWRKSMVQSAAAVLFLAIIFVLSQGSDKASRGESLRRRFNFLKNQKPLLVLFSLAACAVGVELALVGMITSFLMEFHGFTQVTSKLGLIVFLGGVAAGRLILGLFTRRELLYKSILITFGLTALCIGALFFTPPLSALTYVLLFLSGGTIAIIFPLIITLTGLKYPEMSGTALGVLKLGIPAGGIVVPFLLSILASALSFQISLALFPLVMLAGLILAYTNKETLEIGSGSAS
ncbi:MAG: MFS transporter [Anaerolineales bacterium]|jgi:fucose permease